ncbi:hypothetical protein GCM10012278_69660 [Nonomuraea glycinis]|uniref:Uncharacterized protein n=1 Tax=Nonomuraea glycinis TaxID=2047744 RepID=A0A918ABG7_9ACTN|nr:hypothetical protein GCM10012278_69660 [Nonomuraea glycinis]
MLGDIADPQPVRRVHREGPADQILLGGGVDEVAAALAPVDALDASLAHESFDALAVDLQVQAERQLRVDPR